MSSATPTTSTGPTTLYHRRHAKQQRGKAMGHLGPAVVLVWGLAPVVLGQERITGLLALEIAIGALYLVLMVRELLHLRHNPFHRERVAWLELAAAAILLLEGYHIWHRHHEAEALSGVHRVHVLPWLYAAVAVVYVVLAFRVKDLEARRFLHLRPDGFAVRTSYLSAAHDLRWADVLSVEPAGAADLLVHRANGELQRISFADLHDGPAHRDRVLAHYQSIVGGEQG